MGSTADLAIWSVYSAVEQNTDSETLQMESKCIEISEEDSGRVGDQVGEGKQYFGIWSGFHQRLKFGRYSADTTVKPWFVGLTTNAAD